MPYTYATFIDAKQQLANRLDDPDKKFWSDAELGVYIVEALRTWNAHAQNWRGEFTMPLVQGTVWYDITDLSVAPNSLRPMTVQDLDVVKLIQYHFLEPASGFIWTGSLQFNSTDLANAIQRRRDEVLSNTTCTVTRQLVPALPGRTYMPQNFLYPRRVAWIPAVSGYSITPLWPEDEFSLYSFERDFTVTPGGVPSSYRTSTVPPLGFDVDIPPAVTGQYEVLSVNSGPTVNLTLAQTLGVPDDFSWVVTFGAMGELLNFEGNAKDAMRARYCELRYKAGMKLLMSSPAVLAARLNNLPLDIDAAQDMDNFRPDWQAEDQGEPDVMITAGLNLVGFATTPDAGPYSASLIVLRNAPVTGSYIQLGKDDYEAVLDYAQHIATFKMGGTEFVETINLFKRFIFQASLYNSKLSSIGPYMDDIYEMSQLHNMANPVYGGPIQETNDVPIEGVANG